MARQKLSQKEHECLTFIQNYMTTHYGKIPSTSSIAGVFNVSQSTARRYLKSLEEMGILCYDERGVYHVAWSQNLDDDSLLHAAQQYAEAVEEYRQVLQDPESRVYEEGDAKSQVESDRIELIRVALKMSTAEQLLSHIAENYHSKETEGVILRT